MWAAPGDEIDSLPAFRADLGGYLKSLIEFGDSLPDPLIQKASVFTAYPLDFQDLVLAPEFQLQR